MCPANGWVRAAAWSHGQSPGASAVLSRIVQTIQIALFGIRIRYSANVLNSNMFINFWYTHECIHVLKF